MDGQRRISLRYTLYCGIVRLYQPMENLGVIEMSNTEPRLIPTQTRGRVL